MRTLKVCMITIIILTIYTGTVKCCNYYDLSFEKTSENVINEKCLNTNIKDKINIKYNESLSKDEIDALNYCIKDYVDLNKMINNKLLENKNQLELMITYININGKLIKDYKSWSKSKNINVLIPINIE